jgi:hypothetical protein
MRLGTLGSARSHDVRDVSVDEEATALNDLHIAMKPPTMAPYTTWAKSITTGVAIP